MKITLQQVRRMGLFEEIEQPKIVYHMTDRKNIPSILKDGKIKSVRENGAQADFMTFFFPSLEEIPVYIELTGADTGRKYYDFDGHIHTAPPLNHAETVILKLEPRGRQPLEWYKEAINDSNRTFPDEATRKLWEYMNNARICHYGEMRFKDNPEIIELATVDAMPESEKLKEIRRIKTEAKKPSMQK